MSNEQTREIFLRVLNENAGRNLFESSDLKNAISALDKQIPKKYIENVYPWAICPSCGGSIHLEHIQEHIQNEEASYCEHCGQAIDWSESK